MAPPPAESDEPAPSLGFAVVSQKVELDIAFSPSSLHGHTKLCIQPLDPELQVIRLNCRQLSITRVKVDGCWAPYTYDDLYQRLSRRPHPHTGVHQHHWTRSRIERHRERKADELVVDLPPGVHVRPADDAARPLGESFQQRLSTHAGADTPVKAADEHSPSPYALMKVEVEYFIREFRDGLEFVGLEAGGARYPHVYTRNSLFPGTASCLFPCIDDGLSRCSWDISIRYPRTLGDCTEQEQGPAMDDYGFRHLTESERSLEMSAVCSGDFMDDSVDLDDPARKTATFKCTNPVQPRHIGFTVGPFEHVDLSMYRDTEDDDRLGLNAIQVHGFCLPGRAAQVHSSAMILPRAMDKLVERYTPFPFASYKLCFVEDLPCDVAHSAALSICSTNLLFPQEVLDPLEAVLRTLVHALASQWIGVRVTPQAPADWWIVVGASWFMADLFLRDVFGRNDYRFRLKMTADRVVKQDVRRLPLSVLGTHLEVDARELDFMQLKAPAVLAVLHHRLVKQSGKNGVDRCLWRMLVNTNSGRIKNGNISTDVFFDICEKVGHQRLDGFFNQWVHGAGCPQFECHPSFNKKKLMVQLTIKQVQTDFRAAEINPSELMREAKEAARGVNAPPVRRSFVVCPLPLLRRAADAFQGPMTIRIHDADGTPYEHIVTINAAVTKVEIPYNTKYKRLKRSRRQKERAAAAQGVDATADDDVLLYCLGDVLQTEEEVAEWRLSDWSRDDEDRMAQESYEWLRIDSDFEWLCKTTISEQPSYMYVSQLQQDKDVVAQVESLQYLASKEGHSLISSIMARTIVDKRYFHGVRALAADVIANSAKRSLDWIGFFHLEKAFKELFCIRGSSMTRPNDFSDRAEYYIQCAIPKAMARIKDEFGGVPLVVKQFLLDILRYNDNSGNAASDDFYLATLMSCLAQSLTNASRADATTGMTDEADELELQSQALAGIERVFRFDEWVPSFQNVLSTAGLECSSLLMKRKVKRCQLMEFLAYHGAGNADTVRIKAWECLFEFGLIKNPEILRLMVHTIGADPSLSFRSQLLHLFGVTLGKLATGEYEEVSEEPNGLVIEHDEGTSGREAHLARKQTVSGALEALKRQLPDPGLGSELADALWNALQSKTTSIDNIVELLDICSLLYDPHDTLPIVLHYPRHWNAEHLGEGLLRFYRGSKFRTQPQPTLKASLRAERAAPRIIIKLPTGSQSGQRGEQSAQPTSSVNVRTQTPVVQQAPPPPPTPTPPPPPPPVEQVAETAEVEQSSSRPSTSAREVGSLPDV